MNLHIYVIYIQNSDILMDIIITLMDRDRNNLRIHDRLGNS
jgi:hypothetical protein